MAIFLDWFASHNTLVIQSLAAVVALLIVFLIFRLLFAAETAADGVTAKNVTYSQLEEKLNKLLEQQSQMKASISNATDAGPAGEVLGDDALAALSGDPAPEAAGGAAPSAGAASGEQAAELSRLRAEITTLKDSVKRKENEIIDAKDQAQKSINTAEQDAKLNDLSGKITDYENEIDALKNRLSDYEIIAEDIADLQQYKKENQDLKNQLAKAPTPAAAPAPVAVAPAVEGASDLDDLPEAKTEEVVEASAEQVVEENPKEEPHVPNDIFAAANDVMNESSIADSEPEEEVMPETTASRDLDNDEAREVSRDVKKEEKMLLDEFEKHFAKDDD
ncbi:MAG: hypothetical protein V4654_00285 [Bdellovibrionota bacterium]